MKKILTGFALATLLLANACTNESEKAETIKQEASQSARLDESMDDEQVYTVVENHPEFNGGLPAMYEFLGVNIKYPEAAAKANVQGKVFVTFVVGSDGAVRDVKVLKGLGYGTDEEAVRVVKAMPNWKPGSQDGKKVAVKYNLPISFQLD
jgi:periplasmic protein TonB